MHTCSNIAICNYVYEVHAVSFIMLLYVNCRSFMGALFGSLRRQSVHSKQFSQKQQIEDVYDIPRDHVPMYVSNLFMQFVSFFVSTFTGQTYDVQSNDLNCMVCIKTFTKTTYIPP